jgi:hypothetical protein
VGSSHALGSGGDDFVLRGAAQDLDTCVPSDRLSRRREISGFRTSMIFQEAGDTAATCRPDPS